MGKPFSRQDQVARIHYTPAHPGRRAVFLAEARTRKEVRQISELFDMVGQLAEVVPISHGRVMSYAVQVAGDTAIFAKIEWLLKTQFAFSLVERNFSDVTFRLVESLCEDSNTEMAELPECGICEALDPFPTRALVELSGREDPEHLSFCGKCSMRFEAEDAGEWIRGLVSRDRSRPRVPKDTPVMLVPEISEERSEMAADPFAIAI
jgi:hypothetical protein